MSDSPITLSVVIPTRGRPEHLARCLAGLAAQTFPRAQFEVIVVRDGDAADNSPLASGLTVLWLSHAQSRGPAAARNTGWRAASHEAVLFIDDDVIPDPSLLAETVAALARHGRTVAGVEGQVRPTDEAAAAADPLARTLMIAGGGSGHTCNVAYWRTALEAVEGFDERFPSAIAEDYDLAYRLAATVGPIVYVPAMLCAHAVHAREGYRAWQRRRCVAWPSLVRLFVKHPDRFPPSFAPAGVLAVFGRLFPRPTTTAMVAYLLLNDVGEIVSRRRLLLNAPLTFARWTLYHIRDAFCVLTSVSTIAEAQRAARHELTLVARAPAHAGRP